ncbi:MAG: T9SS type A sorting domain-containing protein [Gemmatimonadetes bacterium]|nr:T9SS type A sorting domain-containing protein [Gemmatimonadota bacterium]
MIRVRLDRVAARVSRALVPLALVVTVVSPSGAATEFRKIVLQGDPAPGTEPGTVYAFTDGYLGVLPRIAADGQVAFAAKLEGPAVDESNDVAIWTAPAAGDASLVVRAGDPAPGLSDVTFASFSLDFELVSPEVGSAELGVLASLTGSGISTANDVSVWRAGPGSLALLAREGDPAPDTSPGVTLAEPMFVSVSNLGDLAVQANLIGAGVTTDTNEGFWTNRDGALGLFLREGDAAPDLGGAIVYGGAGQYIGTGYTFEFLAFGRESQYALQGNVTGPGVTTYSNEALFAESGGTLSLLAREGDPAPGSGVGVTFGGNGVDAAFSPISHNGLGQSGFLARLGGAVSTQTAMFTDHLGSLQEILRGFDPAPDTGGDAFAIFGTPLVGESGRIAFSSSLVSDGGFFPPFGIWWDQPGTAGELHALLLPGQSLSSDHSVTVLGTSGLFALSAAGDLTFQATLDDASYGIRPALLRADATGMMTILLDPGHPFDVHGDGSDLRTISTFQVGGVADDGTVALRLNFADGTFGFYTAFPGGATDAPVIASPSGAARLGRGAPNPFRDDVQVSLDLPRAGQVTVDVVDVAGRRVTSLLRGHHEAGALPLAWDGRDASGQPVAAGVYFVRARTEAGSSSRKLVKID